MDTLGKFKTNFLKDRSSFKIGFNNRSPLSNLKGGLDGGIKSASSITIPKLKSTITKDGGSILVPDDGRLEASEAIGEAIGEAGQKIGQAIQKKVKSKREFNSIVDNLADHSEKWLKENPGKTQKDYNEKFSDHIEAFKEKYEQYEDEYGFQSYRRKQK